MTENLSFPTIRQFHRKYPDLFGEHTLRLMEKQGILPGLRVGNRFLINENVLLEQLTGGEMNVREMGDAAKK